MVFTERFWVVSLVFGSRESERSAFSTDLFGRQEASKESGKSNRYSIILSTTHIILVLPYLQQNIGSTIRKLGHQIFLALVLDKVVGFCSDSFPCVTNFSVALPCVSHQMQGPL